MDVRILVVTVDLVMKLYWAEGEDCQVSAHYNSRMDFGDPKYIRIIIVCLDNYYKRYVLVAKLEDPVEIGF